MRISDWSSDVCSSDLDRDDCPPGRRSAADGRRILLLRAHAQAGLSRGIARRYRPPGAVPARGRAFEHSFLVRASGQCGDAGMRPAPRSEEHTSELQSLMRISYAVFCLKQKKTDNTHINT